MLRSQTLHQTYEKKCLAILVTDFDFHLMGGVGVVACVNRGEVCVGGLHTVNPTGDGHGGGRDGVDGDLFFIYPRGKRRSRGARGGGDVDRGAIVTGKP